MHRNLPWGRGPCRPRGSVSTLSVPSACSHACGGVHVHGASATHWTRLFRGQFCGEWGSGCFRGNRRSFLVLSGRQEASKCAHSQSSCSAPRMLLVFTKCAHEGLSSVGTTGNKPPFCPSWHKSPAAPLPLSQGHLCSRIQLDRRTDATCALHVLSPQTHIRHQHLLTSCKVL